MATSATDDSSNPSAYARLVELLERHEARYRVVEHEAEGRTGDVSILLGTQLSQHAKAMVMRVSGGTAPTDFVLAVLPGDRRVDFKRLAAAVGARKARFAETDQAQQATGCVMGAVPPVPLHPGLAVVADEDLLAQHREIAFNAARLDRSMLLTTSDYIRIVDPIITRLAAG